MAILLKFVLYLANAIVFVYLLTVIVMFVWINYLFVPDSYNAIYHQTSLSADIVTRVVLYGTAIIELLAVLAIVFLINFGLLRIFLGEKSWAIAKRIFAIESSMGTLLLITFALVTK